MYSWYSNLLWWRREATRMCTTYKNGASDNNDWEYSHGTATALRHTKHGTNSDWLIDGASFEGTRDQSRSSKFQNSIRIETASQAGLIASLTRLICGTEYINHATCLHVAFLSRFSCRWFVNQPDLIRYEALRCHDPTLHCNNLFFTYPLWLGASFPTKLFDLWAKASKARAKDVVAQLLSTCMML